MVTLRCFIGKTRHHEGTRPEATPALAPGASVSSKKAIARYWETALSAKITLLATLGSVFISDIHWQLQNKATAG